MDFFGRDCGIQATGIRLLKLGTETPLISRRLISPFMEVPSKASYAKLPTHSTKYKRYLDKDNKTELLNIS